jgi:hypothetical protein
MDSMASLYTCQERMRGKYLFSLDPFGGGGYGNIKLTFPLRFWNKIETDG